jgi:hypothetical protein
MNFTGNQTCTKNEIKHNFITFYKIEYIIQLAAQKLKDLLSQVPYLINKKILVQWYVARLLQNIKAPL